METCFAGTVVPRQQTGRKLRCIWPEISFSGMLRWSKELLGVLATAILVIHNNFSLETELKNLISTYPGLERYQNNPMVFETMIIRIICALGC